MKMILTISVISDDNTRNELTTLGFENIDEAKSRYSEYVQSLFDECSINGCTIDSEYTYVFDKNNGVTVVDILDPVASKEACKEIMHRYRVSISIPEIQA